MLSWTKYPAGGDAALSAFKHDWRMDCTHPAKLDRFPEHHRKTKFVNKIHNKVYNIEICR